MDVNLRCSGAPELPSLPLVVVGGGRVGRAFLQMSGPGAVLVKQGEKVSPGEGPVIVATHCSHLDKVLQQTPQSRWRDLVFLQNGMLQPWLAQHNLENNTQTLLYMSASEDTTLPQGKVKIISGGRESLVWGRWASMVVEIMRREGLLATVVSKHESFLEDIVEKLLWSSIFWLLSVALGGLPVGLIATNYSETVHDLVTELLPLASKGTSRKSVEAIVEKLNLYCSAIESVVPSVDMALSEFKWRNGWFLSEKVTPHHIYWLKQASNMSTNSNLTAVLHGI